MKDGLIVLPPYPGSGCLTDDVHEQDGDVRVRPRQLGHVPPTRHVGGVRQELNHVLGEDLRIRAKGSGPYSIKRLSTADSKSRTGLPRCPATPPLQMQSNWKRI